MPRKLGAGSWMRDDRYLQWRKRRGMSMRYHILSLGAGVQSTALYLMLARGEVLPQADAAIFADTRDEPEGVYDHLRWLLAQPGPPILVRSKGRISGDLARGERVASIPAFTADGEGRVGMMRRQCSKEYKVDVINRTIRREICGGAPGRPLPRDISIVQYIGISLDEVARAARIAANNGKRRGWSVRFPLIEKQMSREDCVEYLADKVPHETPRSACVFCPYHSDAEWARVKANPADWAHAVAVDASLRRPDVIAQRRLRQELYVHRSCKPLDQVELKPEPPAKRALQLLMSWECVEGVCGL